MRRYNGKLIYQGIIALIWILGWVPLLILILVPSTLDRFADKTNEIWAVFLSSTVPFLAQILTGLTIEIKGVSRSTPHGGLFIVAAIISVTYLFIHYCFFLVTPFSRSTYLDILVHHKDLLIAMQSLVGISLGAFFLIRK